MSVISITNSDFQQTDVYKNFIKENPSKGYLKIRATAANEAVPVSGVKITVSKVLNGDTIVFFEGVTDESGMINGIELPTPAKLNNDELVPPFSTYDIDAMYVPDNIDTIYKVNVFEGICSVQYINIIPSTNPEMRDNFGN